MSTYMKWRLKKCLQWDYVTHERSFSRICFFHSKHQRWKNHNWPLRTKKKKNLCSSDYFIVCFVFQTVASAATTAPTASQKCLRCSCNDSHCQKRETEAPHCSSDGDGKTHTKRASFPSGHSWYCIQKPPCRTKSNDPSMKRCSAYLKRTKPKVALLLFFSVTISQTKSD